MKALWLAAALLQAAPVVAQNLDQSVTADLPSLMTIYRDLHTHPELSMHEARSPAILAAEARKLGFTVTEHVGKTGVVAVMKNGPGPILLIRADMDALPVVEQTNLPFASAVRATLASGVETGVMHACGHDTHMTTWIATARQMAARKADWSGTLVMIAQPGEETGEGAKAMLDDGLYTRFPKPDTAIAFHDSASLPAGVIGVTPGYALANVDSVDITVKGVGGHGAYPQTTRDPIVLGARIVTTLQTLVSRENDPRRSRGGHGRQLSRRGQAQHHFRRGQAPAHRPQLQARSAQAPARRHRADRARRGDRRRNARRQDAGRAGP